MSQSILFSLSHTPFLILQVDIAGMSLILLCWMKLFFSLPFIKRVSANSWLVLVNIVWMVPICLGVCASKWWKKQRQSWVYTKTPARPSQPATTPTQIPVSLGRFWSECIVEKQPLSLSFVSSSAVIISSGVILGVEQRVRGLRNPLFHSSGVTTAGASHSSNDSFKPLQRKYPEFEQFACKFQEKYANP